VIRAGCIHRARPGGRGRARRPRRAGSSDGSPGTVRRISVSTRARATLRCTIPRPVSN